SGAKRTAPRSGPAAPALDSAALLALEVGFDVVEELVRARLVDPEGLGERVQRLVLLVGDGVVGEGDRRGEDERDLRAGRVLAERGGHLRHARLAALVRDDLLGGVEHRLDVHAPDAVTGQVPERALQDLAL